MKKHLLISFMALFLFSPIFSQIENIEAMRIWSGDQPWTVNSEVNFRYKNNNGNFNFAIGANAGILFKFKDRNDRLIDTVGLKNKFLFLANYSLERAEDQDLDNNWFLHLRYNREFSDFFRIETFIQSQVNQLLLIDSRNLIGAGVRLKPIQKRKEENDKKNSLHLYLGFSYLYEIERSDTFDLDFFNHRGSSYLTASFKFAKSELTLTNTFYYQPLFRNFQNYRIYEDFDLRFPITDVIGFIAQFSYFLNNKTPTGNTEYRSTIRFGFSFKFQSTPPPAKQKAIWPGF